VNQYTSLQPVFGMDFVNTVLAAYKTVPGGALIVGGKVRLSQDPAFAPTPASLIADLAAQEANFSGYTAGGYAAVLSAPVVITPFIQGVLIPALAIAAVASPFVPNDVTGYWLDDGTNVIMAERFADLGIAAFGAPADFLSLLLVLPFNLLQAAA
jgi:hypothetical protein